MRERELRLALVCYGGVSLAVYMHGVVKEIWKLLKASRAFHDRDPGDLADSERVYMELLAEIAREVELTVVTDILAGSSAGGINAVHLAQAIATGQSLEPLRDLWLEGADIDALLDPAARPASRWTKAYAEPIAWLAGRRYEQLVERIEPATREEVRAKLSRFVRSRWFEPPFSGEGFTRQLLRALKVMAEKPGRGPLIPPAQPLDLFVTVTDFHGHPQRLPLHSPPHATETEHRLVIAFHSDGEDGRRTLGELAELALAARATASLPGAFPPLSLAEMDAALAAEGLDWPGREEFLRAVLPGLGEDGMDPHNVWLVDGGVLDNAPFGAAIRALRNRPANRDVDRRFLYIDPMPGQAAIRLRRAPGGGPPGFFTTIFRTLSDIPREQPIRDSLEALHGRSRRMKRLRHAVEGMRPAVEAAVERAFGGAILLRRLSPERLARLRARAHWAAARESGFAYPAYGQLKLSGVVEGLAELVLALGRQERHGRAASEAARYALWAAVRASGATRVEAAAASGADHSPYIAFLRAFDVSYRARRLRSLVRVLSEQAAALPPEHSRAPLEAAKSRVFALLAPFLRRRQPGFYGPEVAAAAANAEAAPRAALEALAQAMGLSKLDAATDAGLIEVIEPLPPQHRRAVLLAYLGFPFFDVAILPLLQDEAFDEAEEIKVDRIAPDDCQFLRPGAGTLKGSQMNAFGAFFARAWRENDYLFGRLQAAERLIDIVLSAAPEVEAPLLARRLKARAARAILLAEAGRLTAIGGTIAELARDLDREEARLARETEAARPVPALPAPGAGRS
jgi:patatin-related protein